jgi:hypothetical protein
MQVEVCKIAGRSGIDALDPAAHDKQGFLGRVQQTRAGRATGKPRQPIIEKRFKQIMSVRGIAPAFIDKPGRIETFFAQRLR